MADYDSADMLARLKRELKRPTSDPALDDTDLYQLLTRGLRYTQRLLAKHGLDQNATWELATTSDNQTYTITSEPAGGVLEVRHGRDGPVLVLGPDPDASTDLVWKGTTFIVPDGRTVPFANGIYVHYTPIHGAIDGGGNEPTLAPTEARDIAILHAAMLWFDRGGFRDTTWLDNKIHKLMFGNPAIPGDVGIVGGLKQPFLGQPAKAQAWWRANPDFTV